MPRPKEPKPERVCDRKEKLTIKQARFVLEYVANNGNGTKAAIAAGYGEKSAAISASENLKRDYIQRAIEEHELAIARAAGITPEVMASMIMDEARGIPDDSTQAGRLKAMQLLIEYSGGFDKNKQRVEHSGGIDLSSKSDEELLEMLEGFDK